jgi:hypothetical protein
MRFRKLTSNVFAKLQQWRVIKATFGALTVLDGVRVIEDGADRGTLELRHIKGGESTLLNDPNGPVLHDLLQQA